MQIVTLKCNAIIYKFIEKLSVMALTLHMKLRMSLPLKQLMIHVSLR